MRLPNNSPEQVPLADGGLVDLWVRDEAGRPVVPSGARIEDLRSKLDGFHFAKEMLSSGELEILAVAEQLMAELDRIGGGYVR